MVTIHYHYRHQQHPQFHLPGGLHCGPKVCKTCTQRKEVPSYNMLPILAARHALENELECIKYESHRNW